MPQTIQQKPNPEQTSKVSQQPQATEQPDLEKKSKWWLWVIIVIIVLIILLGIYYWLF